MRIYLFVFATRIHFNVVSKMIIFKITAKNKTELLPIFYIMGDRCLETVNKFNMLVIIFFV